jgi:hypothetical protein
MTKPKSWDEYEIKARYIPCLITPIPLSHFLILFLGKTFWETLASEAGWILVVSNISMPLVAVIALIHLQCNIGKQWIEESVFGQGGASFPTTDMLLLHGGMISSDAKSRIRSKATQLFGITFPDQTQEAAAPEEARLVAREAIGQIRRYVGKGAMTHQYNIRYGFMRNLIGGFFWAITGSTGCATIYGLSKNWAAASLFAVLAALFLLLYFLKKRILKNLAYTYADSLLTEFITNKS